MEYIGRMVEIVLCMICLTLVPVKNMQKIWEQQKENTLHVHTERFCAKIKENGCLTKEVYWQLGEMVERYDANATFELMIARRYLMPAQQEGGAGYGYGMPVKILYRAEIEEMLLEEGTMVLDGMVFISISIYGRDGMLYSCGGEIW